MVYICEAASKFGWGRPLLSLSFSAHLSMQLGSLIRSSRKTFVSIRTVSSSSGVWSGSRSTVHSLGAGKEPAFTPLTPSAHLAGYSKLLGVWVSGAA